MQRPHSVERPLLGLLWRAEGTRLAKHVLDIDRPARTKDAANFDEESASIVGVARALEEIHDVKRPVRERETMVVALDHSNAIRETSPGHESGRQLSLYPR